MWELGQSSVPHLFGRIPQDNNYNDVTADPHFMHWINMLCTLARTHMLVNQRHSYIPLRPDLITEAESINARYVGKWIGRSI